MSEWQPIETAPKSTHAILVWCPERMNTYVVSWWQSDRFQKTEHCWCHFGGLSGELCEVPSHWMPLPAPPSTFQPIGDVVGRIVARVTGDE